MNKQKSYGSKLKNISDPNLAKSHGAGVIVELVQPAKDNKWGRFYFKHYSRYPLIFSDSRKYYNKTLKLLAECRRIPVDNTNNRHIPDKLREKLDIASLKFLVLNKIGLEYLTQEMLPIIHKIKNHKEEIFVLPNEEETTRPKLNAILTALKIKETAPNILVTLLDRRDVVEHPTQNRLYNALPTEWKNNHLSWVLSGEIDGALDHIVPFINLITAAFDKYIADNQIPGSLTGVQRGIRSLEQYKK